MPDTFEPSPGDRAADDVAEYAARAAAEKPDAAVGLIQRQEHFFADFDEDSLLAVDVPDETQQPSSLWRDAWRGLRRRPLFWISAVLIVLVALVALFPRLFTSVDPAYASLTKSLSGPEPGHPLGFDKQGHDVYARVIYGARTSVSVGLLTTIGVVLVGGVFGSIAGYVGRWVDAVLSRIGDVFFAIPLLLAAMVVYQAVPEDDRNVVSISAVLLLFGWPQMARITRGAVISVKNSEFVTAARALGASGGTVLRRHVLPNAIAPVIVTATVSLGVYIVAEATLSFLGIGLPSSTISWGGDISIAQGSWREDPMVLFWPAIALAVTVLSFIMLGDAVRDALDPKARKR